MKALRIPLQLQRKILPKINELRDEIVYQPVEAEAEPEVVIPPVMEAEAVCPETLNLLVESVDQSREMTLYEALGDKQGV